MLRIKMVLLLAVFIIVGSLVRADVSFDGRSFMINGQRKILISGSIHYPRSTPEMWPDLIQKSKDGGLDVIQTYVFWNVHEPAPGQYVFDGNADLVKFLKLVQAAGLYVHLRIGPFVCAEWNFGGFPVWLKYVPGIEFRTDNGPFKNAMQGFVTKIVALMKENSMFEPQGGPIIMSQIENEYGPVEWEIGAPGKAYSAWAAQMAVAQNTGVPWVMCKQETAPDPMIDSCNGFYCEGYTPNKQWKPKMFTEVWTGWYTPWGGPVPRRPAEDLAFAVARFIHNYGSFFNYYMYHGGTNFGRTSGLFVTTSYDYDGPIDEYGQLNQPKYGHLRDLHSAIKLIEPVLVSSWPSVTPLGKNQEARVFTTKTGACAAFLSNYDPAFPAKVTFQNAGYDLPPWSISILSDCKTVVYNTATVKVPTTEPKFAPVGGKLLWKSYTEWTPTADDKDAIAMNGLWEQINITRDWSDYMWYLTDVNIAGNEGFLKTGQNPVLTVSSAGHALHVFINGQLSGTAYGTVEDPRLTFSGNVKLNPGINKISILSDAVGLAVGFYGETQSIYTDKGSASVQWAEGASLAWKKPLTWYKTFFDTPPGTDPVALDMLSMGKGQIWVNGHSIGRHWPANVAKGNCGTCNYAGKYNETKCQMFCGESSQRWYHIPRSWLVSGPNSLVVFEELGGDPNSITPVTRSR